MALDIESTTHVPVSELIKFLRFIAEHNMLDEVEQHLRGQECTTVVMSFEPLRAVGILAEERSRTASGEPPLLCASNSTAPRPKPQHP